MSNRPNDSKEEGAPKATLSEGELEGLAHDLVSAYRRRVAHYQEKLQVREIAAGKLVDEELAERVRGVRLSTGYGRHHQKRLTGRSSSALSSKMRRPP